MRNLIAFILLAIVAVFLSGCIQVPQRPVNTSEPNNYKIPSQVPDMSLHTLILKSQRIDGNHDIRVYQSQDQKTTLTIFRISDVYDFSDESYKAVIMYSIPRLTKDALRGPLVHDTINGSDAVSMDFVQVGSEGNILSNPVEYLTVLGYPIGHYMTVYVTNVGSWEGHYKLVGAYQYL